MLYRPVEIAEDHRDAHTCADIKSLSDDNRQDLEEQMQNLKMMNTTLKLIFDAC